MTRNQERHISRRYKPRNLQAKPRSGKRQYYGINRRRFLSQAERELIIEMGKMQALSLRLAFLEHELKKAGGFKARSTWSKPEEILSLYEERRKVKQEIKDFKPYAQLKNAYNCNPYYIAKHLKIDAALVFTVLRMFTRTGKTLFSRDRRDHISLNQAKENLLERLTEDKAGFVQPASPVLRARIAPNPCAALQFEKANTTGLNHTPLTQSNKSRNNVGSKRKAESQATLAYTDFMLTFSSSEDLEYDNQNLDDYFRHGTSCYTKVYTGFGTERKPEIIEDQDVPPRTYSYREHEKSIGMIDKEGSYTALGCKIKGLRVYDQAELDRLRDWAKLIGM